MRRERVLGVDACKAGWVGVVLAGGRVDAWVAATIEGLVDLAGPLEVVAVDMPIGLPDRSRRQADVLARQAIGPLRSSVFVTPVRKSTWAGARMRHGLLAGAGIELDDLGEAGRRAGCRRRARRGRGGLDRPTGGSRRGPVPTRSARGLRRWPALRDLELISPL